ncbi:MAG: hypothetical protein K9W44_06090 [Candidatus Lokiarchaeota archaeon]|nr:hypothetical protein [Candidatus Harpocratesius repetitus]
MLSQEVICKDPPEYIALELILNCVRCNRCVPVCSLGVRSDLMVYG